MTWPPVAMLWACVHRTGAQRIAPDCRAVDVPELVDLRHCSDFRLFWEQAPCWPHPIPIHTTLFILAAFSSEDGVSVPNVATVREGRVICTAMPSLAYQRLVVGIDVRLSVAIGNTCTKRGTEGVALRVRRTD